MHFSINETKGYAFATPGFWTRNFVLRDFGAGVTALVSFAFSVIAVVFAVIIMASFLLGSVLSNMLTVYLFILMLISVIFAFLTSKLKQKLRQQRWYIMNKQQRGMYVTDDYYSYVLVFNVLDKVSKAALLDARFYSELFSDKALIELDTHLLNLDKNEPSQIEAFYATKDKIVQNIQATYATSTPADLPKQQMFELLTDQHEAIHNERYKGAQRLVSKLDKELESMEELERRTRLRAL